MFKEMIVSMLIAIASLGTAAAFAAPADTDVRGGATAAKAAPEDGKTRYWSHPRLGMVKVDAAGRMLTARSNPGDAARSSVFGSPSLRVR